MDTNTRHGLFEKRDQATPFPRDEVRMNPKEKKTSISKINDAHTKIKVEAQLTINYIIKNLLGI